MGRQSGGLTAKVHDLTDARGLPLELVRPQGQAGDCAAVKLLLGRLQGGRRWEQSR